MIHDPIADIEYVIQMARSWQKAGGKLTSVRRIDESDMTTLERVIADHIAVRRFLYEHASEEDKALLDRKWEGTTTEILQRLLLHKEAAK